MLGLGLDADAVGPLDVPAEDRPHDADEEQRAGHVAHQRVAVVDVAVQELGALGELVVDLEHRRDGEQDDEVEVDQRVHDAGRGVAQQRLHVDAGAEVLEPPGDVLLRRGPVVGLAPLPVLDPLGEQHGARTRSGSAGPCRTTAFHADGMLPKTSRWTAESSCHCRAVAAMPDDDGHDGEADADAEGDLRGLDATARRRRRGALGLTCPNLPNPSRVGGIVRAQAAGGLPAGHLPD